MTGGIARLRTRGRLAVLVLTSALLLAGMSSGQEAVRVATERSLQAAYLLKFPAYVDWPAERFDTAASPIRIGVLGADDLASELESVATGRTVNARPVVVRRLTPEDDFGDLHVLFFTGRAIDAQRVGAAAAARSILTVTDSLGEPDAGVIEFVSSSGRVRFAVRLDVAERNRLRLHSGLLTVAARVREVRR